MFVDLPKVGSSLKKGDFAGVIESVKAAADLLMPVSGDVVEVNEALRDDPSLANSDPMCQGWFFKRRASELAGFETLMDPAYCETLWKNAHPGG